ncbi:saccharopine dehydrogenase family protein [Steroidobacter flavus]|uniref:Saccharopine dehydrogenase family protein n=1 Tax=Steroidobacter flavus TaxID=1842136 RepID=A0ABV8SNU6_9GAMM
MKSVVVLGGYGNFGRRIVDALARERDTRVFVSGRDVQQATAVAQEIGGSAEPLRLDAYAADFTAELRKVGATIVVHTAGPFQGQEYAVPRACVAAKAHYLDLADGRGFVCGIRALDEEAKLNDALVVSGASSVPALSSAVVDALGAQFSSIESIDHGITSGARPPGKATMDGVLAYAGKPFKQWRDGQWQQVCGWQDLTRRLYPTPIQGRWIANCDVPDLDLFPERYRLVHTVQFRAGVGPASSMIGLWFASWLVRVGLLTSLQSWVPALHRTASTLAPFGSKRSAMHVTVRGIDLNGEPAVRNWFLLADQDHGPFIPCFPAIALARKLVRDEISARGAMPCMGLLTVDDILSVGDGLDLRVVVG